MADQPVSPDLLERLCSEVAELEQNQRDLERNCWMVVHRHRHGMFPSEYDIREIDENLYLSLLDYYRQSQQAK